MKTIEQVLAEIEKRAINHENVAQLAMNAGDLGSAMTNTGAWAAMKMISNFIRDRPNAEGLVSNHPAIQIVTIEDFNETLN